jgi:hypothetical protein
MSQTLVTTIHGLMDVSLLEKLEGFVDNQDEYTTWVEYRIIGQDEIVHRSVHVTKKDISVSAELDIGKI